MKFSPMKNGGNRNRFYFCTTKENNMRKPCVKKNTNINECTFFYIQSGQN